MISIRTFQADDADTIVGFDHNVGADFHRQWAGRFYSYPLTVEQIEERIKNTENTRYFAILSDDTVIGMAELDFIEWVEKECTVCRFLIGEPYRGDGYGRQALDLLCDYARRELGMRKVKLSVFDFNTGAIKCYINAGFNETGEVIRPNGWRAIEMERIMDMSTKAETAQKIFSNGYNCAQAVLGAFCRELGMDEATALKVACGFGGGLRSGEVCGAVSGAVMALGMKCGHFEQGNTDQKDFCYRKTIEFMDAFASANGTVVCRDLLGYDVRDNQARLQNKGRQSEICPKLIASAVQIFEGMNLVRDNHGSEQ